MIDNYEFGSITIDGKRYDHDVIIYKSRVREWRRDISHNVSLKDIDDLISEKPKTIIFGTGASGVMKVPKETQDFLIKAGIEVIVLKTGDAYKKFNSLSSSKDIAAALHLTC